MSISFDEALGIARGKYPYEIDHYEEYADYYVFERISDVERVGGAGMPIVIRKADGVAFNYEAIFFNFDEDADVGDLVSEGAVQ